jgi:hypothetical protein
VASKATTGVLRWLHHLVEDPRAQSMTDNDEQAKKMESILKESPPAARKEARTHLYVGPITLENMVFSERKAYTAAMERVLGLLTEAQRRTWDDLVGEPFAFKGPGKE